jgi:hypothetical protein
MHVGRSVCNVNVLGSLGRNVGCLSEFPRMDGFDYCRFLRLPMTEYALLEAGSEVRNCYSSSAIDDIETT